MIWNEHSELQGKHSVFAPSTPSWLNYSLEDEDEGVIFQRFCSQYAASIGTVTHAFAADRIHYNQKLQKANRTDLLVDLLKAGIPPIVIDLDYIYGNLQNYVNDAISFRMDTEVTLAYSSISYGHADAICFRDKELRIHDLKTGKGIFHLDQLLAYAAYFFLEYKADPRDISTILRIYHGGKIIEDQPEPERIQATMHQIVELDKKASKWKAEGMKK